MHTSPQFKKSITLVTGKRCEKGQKRAAQAGRAIFLNFSRTKTYIASYHLSSHDTNLGLPSDNLAAGRNDTMARKEALSSLRAILIRRRDALRSALNGDLTLLKELRSESPGDVIDAAVDTAQDEISSQLAEVEARELGSRECLGTNERWHVRLMRSLWWKNTLSTPASTTIRHNVYSLSERN